MFMFEDGDWDRDSHEDRILETGLETEVKISMAKYAICDLVHVPPSACVQARLAWSAAPKLSAACDWASLMALSFFSHSEVMWDRRSSIPVISA